MFLPSGNIGGSRLSKSKKYPGGAVARDCTGTAMKNVIWKGTAGRGPTSAQPHRTRATVRDHGSGRNPAFVGDSIDRGEIRGGSFPPRCQKPKLSHADPHAPANCPMARMCPAPAGLCRHPLPERPRPKGESEDRHDGRR